MKSKFIEKTWFGKKSTKNKDNNNNQQQKDNPFFSNNYHAFSSKPPSSVTNNGDKKERSSFDDGLLARGSPRVSREFSPSSASASPLAGGASGYVFSGFDSDRIAIAHPLPQPSISPTTSLQSISPTTSLPAISPTTSFGVVDNNGSGSECSGGGSSVSSTDEQQDHGQLGFFRGYGETKVTPQSRSPCPGSRVGTTTAASPFHQRLASSSLDSPNKRLDDGKNEAHPLPLPPPPSPTSPASALSSCKTCSSPTSPSSVLSSMKTLSVTENSNCQASKWKKGRLLGRGTFGHVYLGFNSENGQMCAIKEVKVVVDDQSSKECLKQLNQEIALLSQLSHPNIVQYYGSELV
ncbi:hypothetical protein M8C21_010930 [Ambrosia artemisiifolia]|uniref:mitogen-activated protein kinase kinase kinase n=1 Tax=Ambrosia artemisiifolia TaxID=4212 RepID=A0AAD5G2N0_AMBAR|nr:hypothetical protein M8C21_010930 [Ambrosia artemisiifolia]